MTQPKQKLSASMPPPTFDALLAPDESVPYCSYPPYCTAMRSSWRKVTFSMLRKEALDVGPDKQREVVSRWVDQMVRRELGYDLLEIEGREKRKLRLRVSAEAAELIHEALKRRANRRGDKA